MMLRPQQLADQIAKARAVMAVTMGDDFFICAKAQID